MTVRYESKSVFLYQLDLSHNTANIGTGLQFAGTAAVPQVPLGAKLITGQIIIQTPFNGTTTLARVGVTNGGSDFGINLDLSQAAGTVINLWGSTYGGLAALTSDRDLWFRYYGSGATSGRVHLNMLFGQT